jgi:hypothetical protein
MTELSEIALKKQHGPKPPSEGPTHCASFSCLLLAGPVSGRTMRVGSPPSKASSTPCHRTGCKKRLETFLYVFRFDQDLRSLTAPRREARSRKSGCLGRAVSLRREEESSFSTDRPSLNWLPSGRRSLLNIARRMPRLLDHLLCLVLTHQAACEQHRHVRPCAMLHFYDSGAEALFLFFNIIFFFRPTGFFLIVYPAEADFCLNLPVFCGAFCTTCSAWC